MSYLNSIRLNFAGQFQAGHSTVNNDASLRQRAELFQDLNGTVEGLRCAIQNAIHLTSFEDVKANASTIYSQIQWSPGTQPGMPPPPYPPLTAAQVALFKAWKDGGFPP